jgi:hypothetical protein
VAFSEKCRLITLYGQLRRTYEAAAEDPLRQISPDPPLPEHQPEAESYFWLNSGKYDRALAGFDELIRLYHDYPPAHDGRAWILATCLPNWEPL